MGYVYTNPPQPMYQPVMASTVPVPAAVSSSSVIAYISLAISIIAIMLGIALLIRLSQIKHDNTILQQQLATMHTQNQQIEQTLLRTEQELSMVRKTVAAAPPTMTSPQPLSQQIPGNPQVPQPSLNESIGVVGGLVRMGAAATLRGFQSLVAYLGTLQQ